MVRQAHELFVDRFGVHPVLAASAPGRVNLIGEHTDYNGGPVLPLALQRRTTVAVGPPEVRGRWTAVSTLDGKVVEFDPDGPVPPGWTAWAWAVVNSLRVEGAAPQGGRIGVASSVPAGAGLSSSSALAVALSLGISRLAGRRLSKEELIEVAWRAEHDGVGIRCGRMDQTVAVLARPGNALLFETATGDIRHVLLPGRVWLVETGVRHDLTDGQYNRRRAECEEAVRRCGEIGVAVNWLAEVPAAALGRLERALPPHLFRRVRHIVTEVARTREAADLAARGAMAPLGELLFQGHASMRDDYEASCPEADRVVEVAREAGALGARITGGGWGGAVVVLAPPERESRVMAEMRSELGAGVKIWWTRAGGGARC